MTRLQRLIALLLVAVLSIPVPLAADEAKSLFNKGRDAEARENYEAAYDFYYKAFDLKPGDIRYRAAMTRTRYLASASYVHKGQQLRDTGKLDEALVFFEKAAVIDPSNFAAQQEISRTRELIDKAKKPAPSGPSATGQDDTLRRRALEAEGPVELTQISPTPITLKLTEDSKVIYQTIGKLAGLNVLFDPDYTSRRISIELNGVTLNEALDIVALESKTFWRPVTANTIFVATDTAAKRKELEQSVVKTFYLSNISQPTELQDMVNAMRTILEVSRIQQLPTQSAIVIRGTPDQVALAEKLVGDIDRAKPEVLIDVVVMQVSRDKVRDLGIQPPASASIALNSATTSTSSTTTGGTTTTPATTGTPNTINLNDLANLHATNFTVTIPGATANFLFTDARTHIIQKPQIRASDGQKASLKIGERVPVATGSFQPGIGGVGINPLVNTQFQYLDVGVNIDLQPTVHLNGDITLKVTMDITSQTNTVDIGGISQPVISQRKIDHQIRLREGEVNLVGGIFEDQDQRSYGGVPGLGQIPILKYLFGSEKVDHLQNEVVFVLIPHLVRNQDVSDLNLRPIDVGTANNVELRFANHPGRGAQGESVAPAPRPATTPQQPQSQALPNSGAVPAPTETQQSSPGGPTALRFEPASITTTNGASFTVNVNMTGGTDVAAVPVQIAYDPKHLSVVKIDNGDFLTKDSQPVALVQRDDPASGMLVISASRPPGAAGVTGQGTVFTITFTAKDKGPTVLSITRPGARNSQQQPIQVLGSQMTVNVQ